MWTSSSSSSSLNPNLPVQHVWDDDTIHPSGLRRSSAAAGGLILQDLFPQDPPALAARPQPPPLASVQGHFRSLLLHPIVPLGAHGGGKRRLPESETFSGDRSQKRMVNNRVSAARSRARKQEINYTFHFSLFLKNHTIN